MVGIVGCSGNTSMYGWPSEAFVIDGATYGVNDEPTASPDVMEYNVTYFTSPTLAPGVHTLVVTNLNGTSPTSLWLDRFWYISSGPAIVNGAPSTGADATSSASSNAIGPTPPLSSISSSMPLSSASESASAGSVGSTSDHRFNTTAIVGGTVGAAVGLLLLATLGIYHLLKHKFTRAQQVPKGDGM
ncbi:hypothetical protein TRAPUB_13166 [Trametes pubescens]|uniref:Uncharacterized protein n=1 Tax=Trametes pubescens TaxID=154538 RepID=A0A1M2VRV9_TRAPU|nr:hypothetical protein TRAPUB_13166 [Trametes pubescens]